MYELPQSLSAVASRSMEDIAAAALAVQANVVTLRVAFGRKTDRPDFLSDIRTPPPGGVASRREMLLDLETVKSYSPDEVLMRLRQVWGEFCALCWMFPFVDPQAPMDFHQLSPAQTIRCPNDVQKKMDEVQRHLWRIQLELRQRNDPTARADPAFQKDFQAAQMMPVRVFNQDVRFASIERLFTAACEYAGMLAAFRWVSDARWSWEAPGIMDVVLTDAPTGDADAPCDEC